MHPQFLNRIFKPWMYNIKLFIMKNLELKKMSLANIEDTLSVSEMEEIMAGSFSWGKCLTGIGGGAIAGFAAGTGNGVAFALGPIGVTWGAIASLGGALLGASGGCFD